MRWAVLSLAYKLEPAVSAAGTLADGARARSGSSARSIRPGTATAAAMATNEGANTRDLAGWQSGDESTALWDCAGDSAENRGPVEPRNSG